MQLSLVPVRTGPNLSAPGTCGSDAPAPEFLPRCPGTWVLNLTLPPSSCVTFGKLLKFSELLSSSAKGQERAVDEMSKSFPAPWSNTFNELSLSWARRIDLFAYMLKNSFFNFKPNSFTSSCLSSDHSPIIFPTARRTLVNM